MKNEIKVGEYIRTDKGVIGKVKRIELDEIDKSLKWYVFDKKRYDMNIIDEVYINKPYIKKHSFNIIDLIEAGDILKYKLKCMDALVSFKIGQVLEITDPRSGNKALSIGFYNIKQLEILKVITKEEFDSIGYEV